MGISNSGSGVSPGQAKKKIPRIMMGETRFQKKLFA
jgi:hypothetical protein